MMPRIRTAHKISERQRTGDVLTDELVDFKSLLLSPDVLKGLSSCGFERPSPIQLKAIPLGRCGLDLISQAKSGTGKTCVFSVIALESLSLDSNSTQVLILAPTREIAVQIKDVITSIGSQMDNLACHVFIGGLPVEDNKKMLKKPCHIAVGTPGRIKFLIEKHVLKTDSMRLFILDEADKLLEENFQEQINWIFSSLPSNKQMMAFSATYPEHLATHLTRYMREPTFVRLNATDPTLQGIKQFYKGVPFHPLPHKIFERKVCELLKLFSSLPFHQCLVFSNYQIRAQNLCDTLRLKGWPSVFIAGSQNQSQRLKAMEKLREFKCRVLISTDLTSRGIDAEHVDLVVNMDVPRDSETYLHRIGRAGRFGTQGTAVTFVAQGEEDRLFKKMEEKIGNKIHTLPDPIPQFLRSGDASGTQASELPKQASVEVDILTNCSIDSSEGEVNKDSPVPRRTQASTEKAASEITDSLVLQDTSLCEQTEEDSLLNKAETIKNRDALAANLQLKDDDLQRRKMTEDMQNTLQKDLPYEKENFDENLYRKDQGILDTDLLQGQEKDGRAAENFQCQSKIQTDLIKSSERGMLEQGPSIQSTETSACLGGENEHILRPLQDLKLDPRSESQSFHKPGNHLPLAKATSNNGAVENEGTSNVGDKMNSSKMFESLSDGSEGSDHEGSETAENSNDLEHCVDGNLSSMEEKRDLSQQLPSVSEFEKYFENYLQKVSNFDNVVEASSTSSDSECDGVGSDSANDSNDRISQKASVSSKQFGTARDGQDFRQHAQQRFSGSQEPFRDDTGSSDYYHQNQNQYRTHDDISGHCGSLLSGLNQNYHWYNSNHNDGWHIYSDSHNYHGHYDNYDGRYNYYYPYPGGNEVNYSLQSEAYSSHWEQYYDKAHGDMRTYQDYQWNMSWYNAYQRQTSCIRQFVAFSRAVRF